MFSLTRSLEMHPLILSHGLDWNPHLNAAHREELPHKDQHGHQHKHSRQHTVNQKSPSKKKIDITTPSYTNSAQREKEGIFDLNETAMTQVPIHLQDNMREIQLDSTKRMRDEDCHVPNKHTHHTHSNHAHATPSRWLRRVTAWFQDQFQVHHAYDEIRSPDIDASYSDSRSNGWNNHAYENYQNKNPASRARHI